MAKSDILITKASGKRTPFSSDKLRSSLERSGAEPELINSIMTEVEKQLYVGIPTKKIHGIAFAMLRKYSRHNAAKYRLKQAIMELGPSGYPFEKYVAEILKHNGFEIQIDVIVKGHCVNHEIDIVAKKEDKVFMVECKYHNHSGIISDLKIPLYIKARFDDVEKQWQNSPEGGTYFHQGWVITNTRFSEDAIQYGLCAGLNLMGWNFPGKGSLKDQIDSSGLHPITCLTTLSKNEKQRLLDKKIVLCKELIENSQLLLDININPAKLEAILKEANTLCK